MTYLWRHRARAASTLALILFPWLASCRSPVPEELGPDVLPVYLVAGQSNAVGFDAPATAFEPGPADQNVLLWWRVGDPPPDEFDSIDSGERWGPLRPQPRGVPMEKKLARRQYGNFRDASGGFGPEVGFAREYVSAMDPSARRPGPSLAIIKVAFSGTSLLRDWDPRDTGEEGACYRALMEESTAALAALRADGFEPRVRGLLWIQGESDASEQGAQRYPSALESFLQALRDDLGSPGMHAALALNTQFGGGKNRWVEGVASAQAEVAARDPLCVYVDTSMATVANPAHFDAAGTLLVGRWMARALLAHQDAPTH